MRLNSTGAASHSIRSINVRVNILSEWTTNRARNRAQVIQAVAGMALCVVACAIALPLCEGARSELAVQTGRQETTLSGLQTQITAAQAAQKSAEPQVATAELHEQTTTYCRRLLGELYQVLDSAKAGMAFSSARIDIREAEAAIECHADAESYEIAAAFAEQAGASANKTSTLSSSRPNGLLAPAGIGFEYVKRVSLQ